MDDVANQIYELMMRSAEPVLKWGTSDQACYCFAVSIREHTLFSLFQIQCFQQGMSLLSELGKAKETEKQKRETALVAGTVMGRGRPVYNVRQLVNFMLL